MITPEIHRDTHNRIPVLWSDIRCTFTGTLTFAVGMSDEAPRYAGMSHLLEHLVMSQVGRVAIMHNARTADDSIDFFAQGTPSAVAEFLNRVGAVIRELDQITDEVVAEQRKVIAAELGEGDQMTGAGPLQERFGASGLGLLDVGAPAHRSHTREQALDWAREWLHAGNATLAFTGQAPGNLDLRLPSARAVRERPTCEALSYRERGWLAGGPVPLAVSMYLQSSDALLSNMAGYFVTRVLLEELRTKRQLIYGVNNFIARLDPETLYVVFAMDPRGEDIVETARATVELLRSICADGPTESTLTELIEETQHQFNDSEVQSSYLVDAGVSLLRFGIEAPGLHAMDLDSITGEGVRDVLARGLEKIHLSLGVIDDASLTPELLSEQLDLPWSRYPQSYYDAMGPGATFKALMSDSVEMLNPKPFRGLRGHQLILDPERLAHVVPKEGIMELRWDDVVMAGVCTDCGHWDVTVSHGGGLLIRPEDWRGGTKAVAALERQIPEDIRYPVSHATLAQ